MGTEQKKPLLNDRQLVVICLALVAITVSTFYCPWTRNFAAVYHNLPKSSSAPRHSAVPWPDTVNNYTNHWSSSVASSSSSLQAETADEYAFIFTPPKPSYGTESVNGYRIDWDRLLLHWASIASFAGVWLLLLQIDRRQT